MPITLADRAVAALAAVGRQQLQDLPPAERRRLADECRRVIALAEPRPDAPKAGLLAELHQGVRAE
jgi:hypothetical protein